MSKRRASETKIISFGRMSVPETRTWACCSVNVDVVESVGDSMSLFWEGRRHGPGMIGSPWWWRWRSGTWEIIFEKLLFLPVWFENNCILDSKTLECILVKNLKLEDWGKKNCLEVVKFFFNLLVFTSAIALILSKINEIFWLTVIFWNEISAETERLDLTETET